MDYLELKQQSYMQKREIRRTGTFTGGAILLYILAENVLVLLLRFFGLSDYYLNEPAVQMGVDTLISLAFLMGAFLLMGRFIKQTNPNIDLVPLEKPRKGTTALCIFAGIGFCMVGNIITGYISMFFSTVGHDLSMPDISYPDGVGGLVLSLVRVAVTAAIAEETAMRGIALQPLKKFGPTFAIFASSFVFALMHGNLIQAPFALIAGFGLGYITVVSGSLWVPMIVHFINNSLAVAVTYAIKAGVSEDMANLFYSACIYVFVAVGIFAVCMLKKRVRFKSFQNPFLSGGQKFVAYITNPTMIIAIVYLLYITLTYIS